jgi:hypothetical protein
MTAVKDTMVQDVDALNAGIFFDGQMYVGGRRHLARPDYFAPYFTAKAESKVPEVSERGISCVSRVFTVVEGKVAHLKRYPEGGRIDSQFRNHNLWSKWERGLQAVAQRAIRENFPSSNDPYRLYFLLEPKPLARTLKKRPGRWQVIPWGFGTSISRLQSCTWLDELTL